MSGTFGRGMLRHTVRAKRNVRKAVTDVVMTMGGTIIARTPVGDPSLWQSPPPPNYIPGTLINNWFTSIGSVTINTVGKEFLRGQDTSGNSSLANLGAVAPNAAGNLLFITNPTPWAKANEFGHSTQAPAGMVRITAREFKSAVKAAVAEFRNAP